MSGGVPSGLVQALRHQKRGMTVYFLTSIGFPQQTNCPFPPLVTIKIAPHFSQQYFFPIWLAMFKDSFFFNATSSGSTSEGWVRKLSTYLEI
jgi:hypothetical protein